MVVESVTETDGRNATMPWIVSVQASVVRRYDTTTKYGCVLACRELEGLALEADGRRITALIELARAFALLGASYSNPSLRIAAGRHLGNARRAA